MLEDSEDPVVKTVQPTIKSGRKWKVVKAVDEAKECHKIKEVIGQTQTDRKGLGSSTAKWWSKAEGKDQLSYQISVRSPALKRKSGTVGKERGPHLSAMPRQVDHRACLELLQNRPLTGAIHMEA